MNDDIILIEELEITARVGVPEEERAQPQRLLVSLTLWPERGFREMQDAIERTIDYAAVAQAVKEFAAARQHQLIETLADEIAAHLLRAFPLRSLQIELRKFVLPDAKYVAVRLRRSRS